MAQEKQWRCRWGQIKVDLETHFSNLNPVSGALEGSHKCSEKNRLEGQDEEGCSSIQSAVWGLRPELRLWFRG